MPSPPFSEGAQAQSIKTTLTHGVEVDRPTSSTNDSVSMAAEAGRAEFRGYLHKLHDSLPAKDKLPALKAEEVHGTPKVVVQAGIELGKVAEKIQEMPSLRPDALEFYKDCALDPQVFRSIRALCFSRAQLLNVELFQDIWDFDPKRIPNDVIELAKSL